MKSVRLTLVTWLIVATGGSANRLHIPGVLHWDMGECERVARDVTSNVKADELLGQPRPQWQLSRYFDNLLAANHQQPRK